MRRQTPVNFTVLNPEEGEIVVRIIPGQVVEIFLENNLYTDPVVRLEGSRLNFLTKDRIDHIYQVNHTKKSRKIKDFPFFLGIVWVEFDNKSSKIVVLLDDGSRSGLSKIKKRRLKRNLFLEGVIENNVEFKIIEFSKFDEFCNTAPVSFLNYNIPEGNKK